MNGKSMGLVLLAAWLLAACGGAEAPDDASSGNGDGDAVVALLDGGELNLDELAAERRWLFVNYWAEWCAPCREEIPELNHFHDEHDDVVVLGVNFDQLDAEAMKPQAEGLDIQFPVALQAPSRLAIAPPDVLPSTYVFGPGGQRLGVMVGPQDLEALEAVLSEGAKALD